jgi:DNA modification methylase
VANAANPRSPGFFTQKGGNEVETARQQSAESSPSLTVEWWPIEQPRPYEGNPRIVSKVAIEKVATSIKEFGWRQPLVVDEEDVIIVGLTRLLAAQYLGLAEIPVHVAVGLSPEKAKAYRLMDNRSNEETSWDFARLEEELKELAGMDLDPLLTGFSAEELGHILSPLSRTLVGEDDLPELTGEAITRPGDLWILGDHRLLCADATSPDDVSRLLAGERPFMMVTDPPYGVLYDPAWRNRAGISKSKRTSKLAGDDKCDWTEAYRLFPGDVAYVWHAGCAAGVVQSNLEEAGFLVRSQIIWAKSQLVISRGHYHWQHEPLWYAVREGRKAKWRGDHSQATIWEIGKERLGLATLHATQKPVEAMLRPIRNHGGAQDSVYDPFLGSGTTLIASEILGRKCFALEIDPRWCDAVVKRFEAFTGKRALRESRP